MLSLMLVQQLITIHLEPEYDHQSALDRIRAGFERLD